MSGGLLGESKCEGKEVGFTFPSAGAPELLPFLPPVLRYGESEGLLSQVFKSAEAMGGAILFFDELDALGGNRERGDVHEASRRVLSVMLR